MQDLDQVLKFENMPGKGSDPLLGQNHYYWILCACKTSSKGNFLSKYECHKRHEYPFLGNIEML